MFVIIWCFIYLYGNLMVYLLLLLNYIEIFYFWGFLFDKRRFFENGKV